MAKPIIHKVKAGDDFEFILTITNKTSVTAKAAKAVVDAAQIDLNAALEADPQVPAIISAAESALNSANNNYALAIVVDISTWDISSSMDWCGKHISNFTVTKTNAALGKLTISALPAVTALWKPRTYDADIEFTINGKKKSSNTFQVVVDRDVTNV